MFDFCRYLLSGVRGGAEVGGAGLAGGGALEPGPGGNITKPA